MSPYQQSSVGQGGPGGTSPYQPSAPGQSLNSVYGNNPYSGTGGVTGQTGLAVGNNAISTYNQQLQALQSAQAGSPFGANYGLPSSIAGGPYEQGPAGVQGDGNSWASFGYSE